MKVVTDRQNGLFPRPGKKPFHCDCPDWADMCKHVTSVLYGVGARLDETPQLLFELRGVKDNELVDTNVQIAVNTTTRDSGTKRLASKDLGGVYGIDLETADLQTLSTRKVKTTKTNSSGSKRSTKRKSNPTAKKRGEKASSAKSTVGKRITSKNKLAKMVKSTRSTRSTTGTPAPRNPNKKNNNAGVLPVRRRRHGVSGQ